MGSIHVEILSTTVSLDRATMYRSAKHIFFKNGCFRFDRNSRLKRFFFVCTEITFSSTFK